MAYQNKSKSGAPRRGEKRKEEKKEFEQKVLDVRRVTRVVAGGKRFSFRATVVIGDKKGRVGVGVAKGQDFSSSVDKAVREAKKELITVPIVKGSIPHQVEAKYGAARVMLKSVSDGRGMIAGGAVRVICSLAGVNNISAKIVGTAKNKLNNARAVIEAFKKLKVK